MRFRLEHDQDRDTAYLLVDPRPVGPSGELVATVCHQPAGVADGVRVELEWLDRYIRGIRVTGASRVLPTGLIDQARAEPLVQLPFVYDSSDDAYLYLRTDALPHGHPPVVTADCDLVAGGATGVLLNFDWFEGRLFGLEAIDASGVFDRALLARAEAEADDYPR